MALNQYDWIIALITIAFCASSFGNGANDVANSYATSVAARTLTMVQVGFLAMVTEFVGAVALGDRVTDTIKNGIIDVNRFTERPGVLILGMACAEFGSATWLLVATKLGFPVSTTQTVVGALVGVGFASQASISWGWEKGSISQVAASWGVSPLIAAGFSAIIFGTIKYSVLERSDPFLWAMRLWPIFIAVVCAILALFLVVEAPTAPSLEEFGAGKGAGIILAVFGGVLIIAYLFFTPYFYRRLVKEDSRVKAYHVILGPLLWKEDPPLFWPGKAGEKIVIDYYENAHVQGEDTGSSSGADSPRDLSVTEKGPIATATAKQSRRVIEPEERFLAPTAHLKVQDPRRLWALTKYFFLQGVTRDCVSHSSEALRATHAKAKKYDNRVEHMWTFAQVASAILMSIAHGSNDVANAVGPWVGAYNAWRLERVDEEAGTPVWILVVAGFLLGAGFWFYGWHIIKALGNRITQCSPTRGMSMELGAAITVLIASRLGLPVSTTQCLTGATMGVALMNYSFGAVNWKQLGYIFVGWVLTLPCAGLIAGLLMLMALNTPHF